MQKFNLVSGTNIQNDVHLIAERRVVGSTDYDGDALKIQDFLTNTLPSSTLEALVKLLTVPTEEWKAVEDFEGEFSEIRLEFPFKLSDKQISSVSGCLGYALKVEIGGEDLSNPEIVENELTKTVLDYFYDANKGIRSNPDYELCFDTAKKYMKEGTPARKKPKAVYDNAGHYVRTDPIGSQLVHGIGWNADNVKITIK